MSQEPEFDEETDRLEFDEGRYLYCVVYAPDDETFCTEGIEGRSVSLLVEDGIGAIVQSVDSVYDSDDMTRVRKWLLKHQSVVDAAGEKFGTPLPVRFDTIFKGGDDTVSEWLQRHHSQLNDALEWLSGCWEYRIEVRWDEEAVEAAVVEDETKLQELQTRIESASDGTRYLLESQYEQQLTDRLEQQREQLQKRLIEDVMPYAVEIQRSDATNRVLSKERETDLATAVQLSVLAERDHEERIGETLEPIAEREQYDVRYTGPWPPYSHAPQIGGEDES